MNHSHRIPIVILGACLSVLGCTETLVVTDSSDEELAVGTTVEEGQTVTIPACTSVTFASPSGEKITLQGPYQGVPGRDAGETEALGANASTAKDATGSPINPPWPIQLFVGKIEIPVGALHGFSPGLILAVLPNAKACDNQIVGYIRITHTELFRSQVVTTDFAGKPALRTGLIPQQAYVRLLTAQPSLQLRMVLPTQDAAQGTSDERLRSILHEIEQDPSSTLQLQRVASDDSPDIRIAIKNGRIWLQPPDGPLIVEGPAKPLSIDLSRRDESIREALQAHLTQIARATHLLRLARRHDMGPGGPIDLTLSLKATATGREEAVEPGKIPAVHEGDSLKFKIGNDSTRPVDATLLLIDSHYGITAVLPHERGQPNRIDAGKRFILGGKVDASKTAGLESAILITLKARSKAPMRDFSVLAHDFLPAHDLNEPQVSFRVLSWRTEPVGGE